jgi:molecular chaperone DnaK (HSP70)
LQDLTSGIINEQHLNHTEFHLRFFLLQLKNIIFIKTRHKNSMKDLQDNLKQLITETMIPESEAFLEELNEDLQNDENNEEIKNSITDMESFLEDLDNILVAIEENSMTQEELKIIYEKIKNLIDEHE